MQITDDERRSIFAVWVRTGRIPSIRSIDGVELKLNPWHDPANGRFTFANNGERYGGGGGDGGGGIVAQWGRWAKTPRASRSEADKPKQDRSERKWGNAEFTGGGGGKSGGGGAQAGSDDLWGSDVELERRRRKLGKQPPAVRPAKSNLPDGWASGRFTGGGGGGFRGGGATGPGWSSIKRTNPKADTVRADIRASLRLRDGQPSSGRYRNIVRNGYTYEIDEVGRTRRVSGALTSGPSVSRSRSAQISAGGKDRRVTDEGGHYIAARFNGPKDAFNHFAQDINFNRGRFLVLEDEWARSKRAGKAVRVRIVPTFGGGSTRPSSIDVWFTTDGQESSLKFPNEKVEKRHGG